MYSTFGGEGVEVGVEVGVGEGEEEEDKTAAEDSQEDRPYFCQKCKHQMVHHLSFYDGYDAAGRMEKKYLCMHCREICLRSEI